MGAAPCLLMGTQNCVSVFNAGFIPAMPHDHSRTNVKGMALEKRFAGSLSVSKNRWLNQLTVFLIKVKLLSRQKQCPDRAKRIVNRGCEGVARERIIQNWMGAWVALNELFTLASLRGPYQQSIW